MEGSHRLKDLLQLQLASDAYAVLHLPFVLDTLTREDFLSSAHSQKWIARINSLIHSKDPAAKWCGLCLAFQTATLSKDLMLDGAPSWISAAMPLLVNQQLPTIRAAMRLLRLVFSSATDVPEFQRQLCIPNIPKFVNALIMIAEQENDSEIFLPAMETLTHIVSLYPSICRSVYNSLSNVTLRHLNGSAPNPTSNEHIEACSRLYSALPLTGGKVNAPNLWRKSLDDTVAFAWGAFLQLRSTYPDNGSFENIPKHGPLGEDPVIATPLALDRLRAAVRIIGHLLSTSTSRPVSLPIGSMVRLCSALLQCSLDDKSDVHADNAVHALERSVIPALWMLSLELLTLISQAGQHHLTPHLPLLLTYIAYHLEQTRTPAHTLQCLRTALTLLANGSHVHDHLIASRLARATMPLLTAVLSTRSQADGYKEKEKAAVASRAKKGKRRAHGYEGDEVFKVGRDIVCLKADEGDLLLASVDLLENLLFRTQLTPPVHSIASRLLLSIYASLPQLPPAILSWDLSLHPRLCAKVQRVCVNLAMGTTSMMRSLALVLSLSRGTLGEDGNLMESTEVDLLLRPRMPPLVRSLPHVEMLSLFRAEESQEEIDVRKHVGLAMVDEREAPLPDVLENLTPQETAQTRPPNVPQSLGEGGSNSKSIVVIQERNSANINTDVPSFTTLPPQDPHTSVKSSTQPTHHTLAMDPIPQTSWLPPRDQFPPGSAAIGPQSTLSSIPPVISVPAATNEDDNDEPMPTIDLGSDSDSEE